TLVDGCTDTSDIVNRVEAEDPDLADADDFAITVYKKDGSDGTLTEVPHQCPASTVFNRAQNDQVVVEVAASFEVLTPLVAVLTGSTITVEGSSDVVVQGEEVG